ncbi:MAG: peptidoglycan DD-metalloendopeptidase family protein [Candidatus Wallbacteria bacterium]
MNQLKVTKIVKMRRIKNNLLLILICVLVALTQSGCRRGGDETSRVEPRDVPAPVERSSFKDGVDGITHTVSQGETLWKIKEIYGISIPALKKYNDVSENTALKKGQKIFIPGSPNVLTARKETYFKKASKPAGTEQVTKKTSSVKKFDWPINGTIVSKFSPESKGIILKVALNSPVKAVNAGEVVFSGQMKGYGNLIILDHLDGMFSIYGFNAKNIVKKGDNIKAGQKVAVGGVKSGEGYAKAYFEIRNIEKGNSEPSSVDPLKYLKPSGNSNSESEE